MNTSFTLEYTSNYIRIRHPAGYEINPESQQKLWKAIGEACKKYNCRYVLAEATTRPSRKMNQLDALKSAGQAASASRDLRVACLFPEYQPDETTEFFINTAYNHGVRIEFFSDRKEALQWLGADQVEFVN